MQAQGSGISWIIQPQLNKGGLLLSGFILSQDPAFLHKNNIHAVLSILPPNSPNKIFFQPPVQGHIILLDPADQTDISSTLNETLQWIQQKLQTTNVLIHCLEGVSASPIVTIHYLMRKRDWSYEEALVFVRERRHNVRPVGKLVEQLKKHMEKYQKTEEEGEESS